MEQLFDAIPSVLTGLGPHIEVDEAMVFAAWARCAGDLLRERTVPLRMFENRLVIAVFDVTWQRHLEELSPRMLFKINGLLGQGTVKFIEFRVDESAVNTICRTSIESNQHANPVLDIGPTLQNAAKAIADEGLRNQFLGAAASYLAKEKILTSNG